MPPQDEHEHGGFFIGDDGSPTGVDGSMSMGGEGPVLKAPLALQAPLLVKPQIVRPTVVRPKAMRPSTSAAMLQRIAQDFQNNPPPNVMPVQIINVPLDRQNNMSDDSLSTTTASTRTASSSSLQLQMEPTVEDAKQRLSHRRNLSETNLGAAQLFLPNETEQEQQPQLQRPTPIRPKALKRTQSQGMMDQISHDFQNLPTQQISLSRAPSAPPPRASSVAPELLAPEMQIVAPAPIRIPVPPRPKPKRQHSGRVVKPSWYHRVAAQNRLGSIQEDANTATTSTVMSEEGGNSSYYTQAPWDRIQTAKKQVLQELNAAALSADGHNNTPAFQAALQTLIQNYDPSLFDPRAPVLAYHPYQMQLEGIGISAGKPTFPGCIGRNPGGDPMYKLGTMSFDMFRPTELVVSVQGTFCLIDSIDRNNSQELKNVPKNLMNDVRHGINPVRTYNIVTPFTIEAWRPEFGDKSPNKGVEQPIHGVMTTYGFLLPYPTQNRFSVWFTGGSLEVDGHKNEKWFQIFDKKAAPKRTAFESSKVLAAKLIMGACVNDEMDIDGTLKYTLTRPVASYIDLIYLDNSLQVLRGSSGTVYVHVRLPGGSGAVHQSTYSDELLPTPVDPLCNNHLSCSPVNRFLL